MRSMEKTDDKNEDDDDDMDIANHVELSLRVILEKLSWNLFVRNEGVIRKCLKFLQFLEMSE